MTGGVVATTTGADARLAASSAFANARQNELLLVLAIVETPQCNPAISPMRGSGRDRSPHSAVPTPIVPDGVIRTEAACLLDLIRVP